MTESLTLKAPGVRCSDAEREQISERLRAATSEGRLTMDELEERLTDVYGARYRHELDVLVSDLPAIRATEPGRWRLILAYLWTRLVLLLGRRGSTVALSAVAIFVVLGVTFAAGHAFEHHGFHQHGDH